MNKSICIVGGTGFIGSHLAFRLAGAGHRIRIPTRRRERHRALLVEHRIELIETSVHRPGVLESLLSDTEVVINLVGILNETGPDRFEQVHVELPGRIVDAMRQTGVRRLLHMSALNADPQETHSRYLRTKGAGEERVHAAEAIDATSFRPSVVFGPGDSFFNRFAALLRLSPLVFPLACPQARFAPVYVGNVVDAFVHALDDDSSIGKRYELCGPSVYTLRELVRYTAEQIGRHPWIIGLPDIAARAQAMLLGLLPGKPFTLDNYYSLQKDSVCRESAFASMGIRPLSVESIVPSYLAQRSARGAYPDYRRYARR